MNGVQLISAERLRQVQVEGYDPKFDEPFDELADAGAAYARAAVGEAHEAFDLWPWDAEWFKPGANGANDPVRDLVKAGALIAAAIDKHSGADPLASCQHYHDWWETAEGAACSCGAKLSKAEVAAWTEQSIQLAKDLESARDTAVLLEGHYHRVMAAVRSDVAACQELNRMGERGTCTETIACMVHAAQFEILTEKP